MKNSTRPVFFEGIQDTFLHMVDVGGKRPTRRMAIAGGVITLGPVAFSAVRDGTVPKGNVLALAEAAGIMGAKKTPDLLPLCHSLPLDRVAVYFELDEKASAITVYAQAVAFAKTGVEMEALTAANIALLTIWDLTKGISPDLCVSDIKLLVKTGGKSGRWVNPQGVAAGLLAHLPPIDTLAGKTAAVLVMSDRAASGVYHDTSGAFLKAALSAAGATVVADTVIPDQEEDIAHTLKAMCETHRPDVVLATGGTGPGPRDVTPEALARISCRMLDGLGDLLRKESLYHTDTAWLSRMTAGMVGSTLVVALPGSLKAVEECWQILSPFLGDALDKIAKQGFGGKE